MPSNAFRERRYRSQDGRELYYREYGRRTPGRPAVLCLPGLTRNSKDFHEFALRHGSRWRVLCPDYRGRGRSAYDRDWRNYHAKVSADDIRHLLAAANVHEAILIGTSVGGLLAMVLAVIAPTVVAGAVLNDIGPRIERRGVEKLIDYMTDERPIEDWDAAARRLSETFPNFTAFDDADWRRAAEGTYRARTDGRLVFDWDPSLVRALRAGTRLPVDLWPLFRALGQVPILAIRGCESNFLCEDVFDRMAEEVPSLVRVHIPGVGHPPSLHEPEAAAALDSFLAQF
jgi:pimeloyl-ACP methyl ester carboxylesterase